MHTSPRRPGSAQRPADGGRGDRWFWAAALLGTLHAAPSAYWAAGGTWLLDTVGSTAEGAAAEDPGRAALVLTAVVLVKLAGAWIPLLVHRGWLPGARWWRALSWLGGAGLVAYGLMNVVLSGAVLVGWIDVADADTSGLAGHALLWGPLFAAWGVALVVALVQSRPPAAS